MSNLLKLYKRSLDSILNRKVTKLSIDENMILNNTVNDLQGKDGEIDKQTLKKIWVKMKNGLKRDLKKGNHRNTLFEIVLFWGDYKKHFRKLKVKEIGTWANLHRIYREHFLDEPSDEYMEAMKNSSFETWEEV